MNEKTKARKSNWLKTLKAAEESNIETSSTAFVDWITEIGGIERVRDIYAKPRGPKTPSQIEEILAGIHAYDDQQIELPFDLWGQEHVEGLSLMLVKHCSGNKIAPVLNLADERQIIAAWETFEKQGRKIERELSAELEASRKKFDRERLSKVRAEFKKAKRRGRTRLTFDEFLDEFEGEHPLIRHNALRVSSATSGFNRYAFAHLCLKLGWKADAGSSMCR